jgi:hypothetical protein
MRIFFVMFILALGSSAYADDLYFNNGKINFDKQKYKSEFEQMQKMSKSKEMQSFLGGHDYCIRCSNGTNLNCSVPIGGEVGRVTCATYGLEACGGGQVDYNGCP